MRIQSILFERCLWLCRPTQLTTQRVDVHWQWRRRQKEEQRFVTNLDFQVDIVQFEKWTFFLFAIENLSLVKERKQANKHKKVLFFFRLLRQRTNDVDVFPKHKSSQSEQFSFLWIYWKWILMLIRFKRRTK